MAIGLRPRHKDRSGDKQQHSTQEQLDLLRRGLDVLGIALDDDTQHTLLDYVDLLIKWNRVYNLTAVRQPDQIVVRHLLDSLAVLPYLNGPHVLDVGTGPGLPGIPLALACPDWSFALLDSNTKKTRFLVQAVAALELQNVTVVSERIEDYRPPQPFDTVIARAFASVEALAVSALPLLAPHGRVLAMKGVYPLAELETLPAGFRLAEVPKLAVPFLDAERHLVILERV